MPGIVKRDGLRAPDAPEARAAQRDFVLGIDFGGTKMALATAGIDGEPLLSARLETEAARGAAQAVERAVQGARALVVATRHTTGGDCLAVGAVSPGIVRADRVLLAPNLPGWEELSLPSLLAAGLGQARIRVWTDVKAAALAELRWGSLRDADPAILIVLGTGLAAAIVIGGKVLLGANGAAGEIGYSSLRVTADDQGAANGHAPLEELVGGRAIGTRGSRLLGTELTAADVFAHPDPRARLLVDETLAELAVHTANMAIVIDPARIAVGGGLMGQREAILTALGARLRAAVPFPPQLVAARFVQDGSLRGAIALALDAAPRESRMSLEEEP